LPRFFVSADLLSQDSPVLDGEHASHIKVLRLSRGDSVVLCDGNGAEAECVITDFADKQVMLSVSARRAAVSEPKLQCSIYVGFPKADKFEHIVQKATELGATEIVIFIAPSSITSTISRASHLFFFICTSNILRISDAALRKGRCALSGKATLKPSGRGASQNSPQWRYPPCS